MEQLTTAEAIAGFLTPTAIFLILLALHCVIPARRVDGYDHPNTVGARYRLNGASSSLRRC